MKSLSEIEAAVSNLPLEYKQHLLRFLQALLQEEGQEISPSPAGSRSVLDIQPVTLGKVLRPLDSDDDILEEMLEGQ